LESHIVWTSRNLPA